MNKQISVFDSINKNEPLAARLRPSTLEEFVGQRHLIGEGKVLRNIIKSDNVPSMIFWGPPGVGKTTLAKIIANTTKANFVNFSAVTSGIKDIKTVMKNADERLRFGGKTIVFVDEIHRFNKAQQDAFLPFVEKGSIILIGATTENPSFEINGALLSRTKVFVLNKLEEADIINLLNRAVTDTSGYGDEDIEISHEIIKGIAKFADGDARNALSTLEMLILNGENQQGKITITKEIFLECTSRKSLMYDKNGEQHYNLISALHKSMRNSDPDASVYWLARMLEQGESILYIARRIVRFAAEDIGLADPAALNIAVSAYQASHFIGFPECNVCLTEAVIYMAMAPKSNSMEAAYLKAKEDVIHEIDQPVPMHLCNGVTDLMKEIGYGKGYQYAHDYEDKITNMTCLPDNLTDREYFKPNESGKEIKYKEKLENIRKWKKENRG